MFTIDLETCEVTYIDNNASTIILQAPAHAFHSHDYTPNEMDMPPKVISWKLLNEPLSIRLPQEYGFTLKDVDLFTAFEQKTTDGSAPTWALKVKRGHNWAEYRGHFCETLPNDESQAEKHSQEG